MIYDIIIGLKACVLASIMIMIHIFYAIPPSTINPSTVNTPSSPPITTAPLIPVGYIERLYQLAIGEHSQLLFSNLLHNVLNIGPLSPTALRDRILVIIQPAIPPTRFMRLSRQKIRMRSDMNDQPTMEEREQEIMMLKIFSIWFFAAEVIGLWCEVSQQFRTE